MPAALIRRAICMWSNGYQPDESRNFADFGKNIIPTAIEKYRVQAYIFQGYWEDIGTIDAFFEANLNLTDENPRFNFNEPGAPVYTHPRFLPGTIRCRSYPSPIRSLKERLRDR